MSRILMVVTAADSLVLADGTTHPTGFWAEELVTAHRALTAAGHEVVIATRGGRPAPVDPASLTVAQAGAHADEYATYLSAIADELRTPLKLGDGEGYAAIVIPGGHGPMSDLAHDPLLGEILTTALRRGTIIAPFCHGPAALLSAGMAFAGRRLTVFTNEEELSGGLGVNAPYLVADRLRAKGVLIEDGPAWSSHVVIDGSIISGQNPQSSDAVAHAVINALNEALAE